LFKIAWNAAITRLHSPSEVGGISMSLLLDLLCGGAQKA